MTEDTESVELNNARERGNMFILEPDIGLGDHIASRSGRTSDHPRREESSISFRRFLQNDGHGNRSTHPDLYSCTRQDPSNEGASIDPGSPDLPDFVQDHLAVEQIYFNDTASPAGANLPDFASLIDITRRGDDVVLERNEQRRCRNRVPLDLPVPNFLHEPSIDLPQAGSRLPFDLTTDSGENNITSNGSHLPDFLSDGHILGSDNSSQNMPSTSSKNHINTPQDREERISVSMLERDNERLREELQILRSALLKKDDRIKELEDIVMALEISKLQMLTDANTQTVAKANDDREVDVSKSNTDHLKSSEAKKLEAFSEACRNDGNPNLALRVREMTNVSERLVRELLKIITDFQFDIDKGNSPLPNTEGQSTTLNSENIDNMSSSNSSTNSRHPI